MGIPFEKGNLKLGKGTLGSPGTPFEERCFRHLSMPREDNFLHCLVFICLQEVVGGMVDVEPRLWRKPLKQSFEEQRKKVVHFSKQWKPFDWTLKRSETDTVAS